MASSTRRAAAGLLLVLTAGSASAGSPAEWGPYFSMDMGSTTFNVHKGRLDNLSEIPSGSSNLDEADRGYSLAAGFRFSPYFAVEAAYLDLGKSSYLVQDQNGAATLGFGSSGAALSLLGSWPITNHLSLEARGGVYFGESRMRGWVAAYFDILDGELEWLEAGVAGNAGLLLGAGVVQSFGSHWALRLGYDYVGGNALAIRNTELQSGMESSAGRLSVGIRYLF
jgi:opacity protein-like surface antigen